MKSGVTTGVSRVAEEIFGSWDQYATHRVDHFGNTGTRISLFLSDMTVMAADRDYGYLLEKLFAKADMKTFVSKLVSERRRSGLRWYGRRKKK